MSWYRTGSASVTNGSTTVTGGGTAWVGAVSAGWAFNGPDGQVYEIAAVVSATQITLASAYQGGTQSGAGYSIIPTQGLEQTLVSSLSNLLTNYQGVYDGPGQGRFPDGTVSAPGVRFAADEDTGFYRPASNQLAAAIGGVQRSLLSSTAFQVDVPITGTAVQSSATDATPGRLMKVGAFGIGGEAVSLGPADDLDDIVVSGLYYNATSANAPGNNYPSDSAGSLIVIYHSGIRCVQYFTVYGSGDTQTYVRSRHSGGWSGWHHFVDQSNLVGSVSQASGLPTGAVIERGANANGEYLRLADGTQICWRKITLTTQDLNTAFGSLYRSANLLSGNQTYVASFISPPSCAVSVNTEGLTAMQAVGGAGDTNNTPSTVYAVTTSPVTGLTIHVNYVAVGRWF